MNVTLASPSPLKVLSAMSPSQNPTKPNSPPFSSSLREELGVLPRELESKNNFPSQQGPISPNCRYSLVPMASTSTPHSSPFSFGVPLASPAKRSPLGERSSSPTPSRKKDIFDVIFSGNDINNKKELFGDELIEDILIGRGGSNVSDSEPDDNF